MLRMNGFIPQRSLYAFMAWTGVNLLFSLIYRAESSRSVRLHSIEPRYDSMC